MGAKNKFGPIRAKRFYEVLVVRTVLILLFQYRVPWFSIINRLALIINNYNLKTLTVSMYAFSNTLWSVFFKLFSEATLQVNHIRKMRNIIFGFCASILFHKKGANWLFSFSD
jgi:hypothetical protein